MFCLFVLGEETSVSSSAGSGFLSRNTNQFSSPCNNRQDSAVIAIDSELVSLTVSYNRSRGKPQKRGPGRPRKNNLVDATGI